MSSSYSTRQAESHAHDLEERNAELATRASTDRPTGLHNRAHFDQTLAAEIRRRVAGEARHRLGLLMIDVDHFKRFNDTYGHLTGDRVLETLGRVLRENTREGDVPFRYGGEEFAVLSTESTPEGLRVLGERIRSRVARESLIENGERLRVTVSVGGATLDEAQGEADGERLVRTADELLYKAKALGRNRCEFQ